MSEFVVRRRLAVVGSGARESGFRWMSRVFPRPNFDVDPKPNSVSVLSRPNGEKVEFRCLNNHWVSPEPVPQDWSAWYKPRAYCISARSPSLDVEFPCSVRSDIASDEDGRSWSSRDTDYDDILYYHFNYPSNGQGVLFINTLLYNKFVGRIDARGLWDVRLPHWAPGVPLCRLKVRLRNIKIGKPAVIRRLQIGTVARAGSFTFIHNLEGRMANTSGSALQIDDAHHQGKNYHSSSCKCAFPLPSHVRIVYIDTRKLKWCSVDSVAFHSFAWPRSIREARSIARTLFINHCAWVDVLIVRGRCFGPNQF